MGRWWIVVLLVLDLTGVLIVAVRRGEQGSPSYVASVLPTEQCSCWQGIQPTDYKTVRNAIANLPHATPTTKADQWQLIYGGGHDHLVKLDPKTLDIAIMPTGVRLGDLVAALGAPDFQVIEIMVQAREVKDLRIVEWFYSAEHLRVTLGLPRSATRLSPQTPITALHYESQAQVRPFNAQDWGGFTRLQLTGFGLR